MGFHGQEEVYAWAKYFGYHDKADVTLTRFWLRSRDSALGIQRQRAALLGFLSAPAPRRPD